MQRSGFEADTFLDEVLFAEANMKKLQVENLDDEIKAFSLSIKAQIVKLRPRILHQLKLNINKLLNEAEVENKELTISTHEIKIENHNEWKVEYLDEDYDVISAQNLIDSQNKPHVLISDTDFCSHDKHTSKSVLHSREEKIRPLTNKRRSCVCDVCGLTLRNKYGLERHMMIHSGELPFPCPVCPHRSRLLSSLQSHMRAHNGEKPFQCHLCPSTFLTSSNRLKHLRSHSNIKAYRCDQCEKAYRYKSSLDDHKATFHFGYKRHSCNVCEERFVNDKSLRKHLSKVHQIVRRRKFVKCITDKISLKKDVKNATQR